jgi:thiamine biosynthesis lipoprotein
MLKLTQVSRRQFLRIVAASGAAALAFKTGLEKLRGRQTVTQTRVLMGTVVNLTLVTGDPRDGQAAMDACLTRMTDLEEALSRFRPDSQVSRLNREGVVGNARPELLELLELSRRVSDWSSGAFDITVKPVLDRYRRAAGSAEELPSERAIAEARELVDYRRITIDDDRVSLAEPGMAITLDGVAKGYIIEAGVDELRDRGFSKVMVEAGGDLLASGEREDGDAWRIGIRAPRASRPGPAPSLSLRNQAVATSGDYMQAFSPDYSHHHIIDPRTGYSDPELASATVVASRAAVADALATAVMVMGVEEGARLIRTLPGCEATLVTKELETIQCACETPAPAASPAVRDLARGLLG